MIFVWLFVGLILHIFKNIGVMWLSRKCVVFLSDIERTRFYSLVASLATIMKKSENKLCVFLHLWALMCKLVKKSTFWIYCASKVWTIHCTLCYMSRNESMRWCNKIARPNKARHLFLPGFYTKTWEKVVILPKIFSKNIIFENLDR